MAKQYRIGVRPGLSGKTPVSASMPSRAVRPGISGISKRIRTRRLRDLGCGGYKERDSGARFAPSKNGYPNVYAPNPIVWLALRLIDLYSWVVILAVVMNLLVQFGVINTYNRFARAVVSFLDAMTEPVFRQVRRFLPPLGGIDISPLIVLIVLQFIGYSIEYYL